MLDAALDALFFNSENIWFGNISSKLCAISLDRKKGSYIFHEFRVPLIDA